MAQSLTANHPSATVGTECDWENAAITAFIEAGDTPLSVFQTTFLHRFPQLISLRTCDYSGIRDIFRKMSHFWVIVPHSDSNISYSHKYRCLCSQATGNPFFINRLMALPKDYLGKVFRRTVHAVFVRKWDTGSVCQFQISYNPFLLASWLAWRHWESFERESSTEPREISPSRRIFSAKGNSSCLIRSGGEKNDAGRIS